MAVLSCTLISNGFRLSNREFWYEARYRIRTDSRAMSSYSVISGAVFSGPHPFPAYFSTYALFGASDPNSFMQEASCDQLSEKEATTWIATAVWSPMSSENDSDDFTSRENPLLRPVVYSLEWEEISIPVEQGWNKEALPGISRAAETFGPIQNAAGQEPSTPILKTKRIPVIVAEKNYATLDQINAVEVAFGDSLNDASFKGYAAGECVFRGIDASKPKFAGGMQYYTGEIRIACQRGGWDYEMVNRGWKYLDSGTLKEATIEDENGDPVPVAEPINLELNGTRTPDGQIGTVINWRHRPKVNYNGLGI